jgi:hypothetical protein
MGLTPKDMELKFQRNVWDHGSRHDSYPVLGSTEIVRSFADMCNPVCGWASVLINRHGGSDLLERSRIPGLLADDKLLFPNPGQARVAVLNRPISLNRNPTGCSKERIFSSSWIFLQEEDSELRFRPRSWRVNAGAEPVRSNDPLYPSFRPAEQA